MHLHSPAGRHASLRELASSAGVSVPTLKHYFGTREDLIAAIFEDWLSSGAPYLAWAANPTGSFDKSIRDAVAEIANGFRMALGSIYAVGLMEALRHERLGPDFIAKALDPMIDAYQRRLEAHLSRGEMRPLHARYAALVLISPIVVAFLHQGELGGSMHRPLDMDNFLATHVDAFLRGYGVA